LSNDSNSRSGYRAKRKKTNVVLNTLIVVVLLLIIFVAYNIFASGNDNTATSKTDSTKTEQTKTTDKKTTDKKTSSDKDTKNDKVASDDNSSEDTTADEQDSEEATVPEQPDDTQAVVTDGESSSTTQTGEHKMTFEGEDWQQMINAISSATGLDQSNMTVYWLGSDKSTANAAIGTVASKDKSKKYKVYIKWVDGQGYVPTKVEELSSVQ